MKTYERKVEFTDTVGVVELKNCYAVKSSLPSIDKIYELFISKRDAHKLNYDHFRYHETERHYLYHSGKFGDILNKYGMGHNEAYEAFREHKSPIEVAQDPDFDEDDLLWCDFNSHLLYKLDAKNPTSFPYHCSYIGGVENKSFDLKKAEKILAINPNVSKLSLIEIPYYNKEPGKTHALEFYYRYPQDVYELAVEYFRDELKQQYWSSELQREIIWHPYNRTKDIFDHLNLKDCYIGRYYEP